MEPVKLKKIKAFFKWIEFSPHEFGIAISMFAIDMQRLLLKSKKSQKYRVEIKCYQVIRDRKKHEAKKD